MAIHDGRLRSTHVPSIAFICTRERLFRKHRLVLWFESCIFGNSFARVPLTREVAEEFMKWFFSR